MSSQPRLVLATTNQGKLAELRTLLTDVVDPEVIVDMGSYNIGDIVEDGISFAENSALKARLVTRKTALPAIADDSGLCVDVLGGAPGIFSARWSGQHGADRANYELLLAQLADVPAQHRAAEFRCVATLALPNGEIFAGTGIVRGRIGVKPEGTEGFGYDPIFIPEEGQSGTERTLAQFTAEQKNQISHRARALAELKEKVVSALQS